MWLEGSARATSRRAAGVVVREGSDLTWRLRVFLSAATGDRSRAGARDGRPSYGSPALRCVPARRKPVPLYTSMRGPSPSLSLERDFVRRISIRLSPVPVTELSTSDTRLMMSDPQKAGQKPATTNAFISVPTK